LFNLIISRCPFVSPVSSNAITSLINFSSYPKFSKKFGSLSSGGANNGAASILSLKYYLSSPNGSKG